MGAVLMTVVPTIQFVLRQFEDNSTVTQPI
jgi:hypothetical protein